MYRINIEDNSKIQMILTHNSIILKPWKKRKWNKECGVETGTCPQLEKHFSTFDSVYHRFKPLFDAYNPKTKTFTLPSTVDKNYVMDMLTRNNVDFELIDNSNDYVQVRETYTIMKDNIMIRDKFQAQAIDFLTNDNLYHSKLLSLYTGRGKTFCAISSSVRLREVTLIVSPTLKDQWCEKINEYTDASVNNGGITVLSGMSKIESLLHKKAVYSSFYLSSPKLLVNFIEKYGTLDILLDKLGVGILCFDEFHTFLSQNILITMNSNVKHTFYLTATPGRSKRDENIIFDRLTKIVPSYGSNTFHIDNYYNIRYINYNTEPNEFEKSNCFTSKGLSGVLYWNYIFNNNDRRLYMFNMIKYLIDRILDRDHNAKILIYLAKIEHIERFQTLFKRLYGNDIGFGNYTTSVDKNRKRAEISNNVIFTTIGSGGVGLDIPNLTAVFSLVPISSKILTSQMLGRLRYRPDGEVYFYDFCDEGFENMKLQRKSRDVILISKSKSRKYIKISYSDIKDYL